MMFTEAEVTTESLLFQDADSRRHSARIQHSIHAQDSSDTQSERHGLCHSIQTTRPDQTGTHTLDKHHIWQMCSSINVLFVFHTQLIGNQTRTLNWIPAFPETGNVLNGHPVELGHYGSTGTFKLMSLQWHTWNTCAWILICIITGLDYS